MGRDATRRARARTNFLSGVPGETSPLPICMNLIMEFSFCRERETLVADTALHRMLQNHRTFQPHVLRANGK